MDAPEILRKAADLIEKWGLCKFTFETDDGKHGNHCTMGAILEVATNDARGYEHLHSYPNVDKACRALLEYVSDDPLPMEHVGSSRILLWNDAYERKQDEVVGVLRTVANLLDKKPVEQKQVVAVVA